MEMFTIIICVALVSLCQGQSKPCGRLIAPPNVTVSIIGEEDTSTHETIYPWHLALQRQPATGGSWEYSCGATLIYPDWALTSAWCVDDPSYNYQLIAGEYNRSVDEGTEQYIDVAAITMHPEYNYSAPFYADNLALLQLATPADLTNDYVNVACLPPSDDTSYVENPNCYVTGWGVTEYGGDYTQVLKRAGTDVIRTQNWCLISIGDGFWVNDEQYCIQDQANKDVTVCDGDEGGPLSCMVDFTWYLAGTMSHVTSPTCHPDNPQIYSNTAKFLTWISDVTGQ